MNDPAAETPPLHVVAGVLNDARGRILLARREGTRELAGLWEFPGGKVEPGESAVRQLHHGDLVGLLLGYEHLCLDTVVVECLHKAVGCYCGTTRLFASVDN